MIAYKSMRSTVAKGLAEYIGIPVIRSNQTAKAPAYPYASYTVTTIAAANNGTWQQHSDGIDRKMVRSIWSFSFLATDFDESIMLATKAREWFEHSGRVWLSDNGITVQSTTDVTNRDNILTVEYERKNGFDVVFYVYDETKNPSESTGYIERVETAHETTT